MRVAWESGMARGIRGEPQMLLNSVLRLTADTLMNIRSSDKKPGPLLFPPCD